MSTFFIEIRQALRSLRRSPGFTVPVVLVLALGIGVNVALHAILQAVLFRPLPVPRPDRLVKVVVLSKGSGEAGSFLSHPRFEEVKASVPSFQQMAASLPERVKFLDEGLASQRTVGFVDPEWFTTLGIRPSLGRFFSRDEAQRGEPLAVLGEALWRDLYRRDPGVVGRSLNLNGRSVRVVGIAPPSFEGLDIESAQELWMPMASRSALIPAEAGEDPKAFLNDPEMYRFDVVGRLRDDATPAQAQAALDVVARTTIFTPRESSDLGFRLRLQDLHHGRDRMLDEFLPQRPLLFGATSLALLLAIVGAAGLISARTEKRRREMLLRGALGATGWTLARPLLLEALLVALLTFPLAVIIGMTLARHFMGMPGNSPLEQRLLPMPDPVLLLTALGLCLVTLLGAALGPVLAIRRLDLAQGLRQQSTQGGHHSSGGLFVVAQVALSLALLTAASVALAGLRKAGAVGYPVLNRAILRVDPGVLPQPGLAQRLLARVQGLPGVQHAALGARAPLDLLPIPFHLKGESEDYYFPAAIVGPGWFGTLGVPLQEGRDFTDRDEKQPLILNEALAHKLFPQGMVTGRLIPGASRTLEVVGVVKDHRQWVDPDIHQPMMFLPWPWWRFNDFTILVESRGPAEALLPLLRQALEQEAPGLAPAKLQSMESHLARVLRKEHQNLRLLGLLGIGSLVLACFGLWAALNLHVAMRWRDMGIRAALGASMRHLLSSVMGLGLRLLGLGLAFGLAGVWALMRLSHWRWPGLPTLGILDLTFSALTLLLAGLLACLIPALRAARVNPAEALRSE